MPAGVFLGTKVMKTRELLKDCFDAMLSHFGPRGWWPAKTSFEVMVGAILTQNTNWKNVESAISNLSEAKALSPEKMLALSPERLSELIRPAGYFRVKENRLRSFLTYFVDSYGGDAEVMKGISTQVLREELLKVKGIGPETADSILLYALEKPVFVVDAYTRRIFLRHDVISESADYAEIQDAFTSNLPEDVSLFNEYHALIVETAKAYCKTKPACEGCPLSGVNGVREFYCVKN